MSTSPSKRFLLIAFTVFILFCFTSGLLFLNQNSRKSEQVVENEALRTRGQSIGGLSEIILLSLDQPLFPFELGFIDSTRISPEKVLKLAFHDEKVKKYLSQYGNDFLFRRQDSYLSHIPLSEAIKMLLNETDFDKYRFVVYPSKTTDYSAEICGYYIGENGVYEDGMGDDSIVGRWPCSKRSSSK